MEINRHNYETFLLDLLEGNLSVEDQQQVHNFLLLNPDCARELMEIEPWVLEGEELSFQNKGLLKKEFPDSSSSLNEYNFDLFSIARMEGDLSDEQEDAHQAMLALDDLKSQQWSEWQQTRLLPEKIEYKEKDRLKRKSGLTNRTIWMGAISTAAALTLIFILLRTGPDLPPQEQALQTPLDLPSRDLSPQQSNDVTAQADIQTVIEETQENQAIQTSSDPTLPKTLDPVLFSVKKEHEHPVELETKMAVVSQDDIQPRLLASSVMRINSMSPAGEAVPDKIEALYVPPVPVHLSSLTAAQLYDMDLQEVIENYREEKDFSLLTIANAGIKGINKLARTDISLLASRDEEGEVSGFQLKGKRFSLVRPLDQEE